MFQVIPTGSQLDFESSFLLRLTHGCVDTDLIIFSVNAETTEIDQKVWISGKLVSSQSDSTAFSIKNLRERN